MADFTLTNKPPVIAITLKQGDIYGWNYVTFPYDITGYTFAGQIRKNPEDVTAVADITFEIINAAAGEMRWAILAGDTASLTCHPTDLDHADSAYVADLQAAPTDTTERFTLCDLEIKVWREVTRP